jgi:hypothetical protein
LIIARDVEFSSSLSLFGGVSRRPSYIKDLSEELNSLAVKNSAKGLLQPYLPGYTNIIQEEHVDDCWVWKAQYLPFR